MKHGHVNFISIYPDWPYVCDMFLLIGFLHISEPPGRLTYPISTGTISLTTNINRNKCKRWVNQQKYRVEEYKWMWSIMPDCPCSAWILFFDRRFEFVRWWFITSDTFTSSILPFWWLLPLGKVCNLLLTLITPCFLGNFAYFCVCLYFPK